MGFFVNWVTNKTCIRIEINFLIGITQAANSVWAEFNIPIPQLNKDTNGVTVRFKDLPQFSGCQMVQANLARLRSYPHLKCTVP